MKQQMLEAEVKELKARIETLTTERDAQCCMCGKKGLSTEEDGGPECELSDGRWVCSEDCWNDALEPDAIAAYRIAALTAELVAIKEAYDDVEQYARRHCAEVAALTAENARLKKGCEYAMSEIRDYMQEVGGTLPLELAMGWLSAALNSGKEGK
jgi:hypothetical protein